MVSRQFTLGTLHTLYPGHYHFVDDDPQGLLVVVDVGGTQSEVS